jgi:hypothetical protein
MAKQVTKEQVDQARKISALEYFNRFEPGDLEKNGSTEFRLKSNHSVSISPDESKGWYDHGTGVGGYTALDLLMKVRGVGFIDAVEQLAGVTQVPATEVKTPARKAKPAERKTFALPEQNVRDGKPDNRRAAAYLHHTRGIDYEIINHHIKRGALYEDASTYHNIVFVGEDKDGYARYASLHHSTSEPERRYVGEAQGSDKHYSFSERGTKPEHLVVCEGSIDAMSAQTLLKYQGQQWRDYSVLSLGGVAVPVHGGIPAPLQRFLDENPDIKTVILSLDNDEAGRFGTQKIGAALSAMGYKVLDRPPKTGKDINDELKEYIAQNPTAIKEFEKAAMSRRPQQRQQQELGG